MTATILPMRRAVNVSPNHPSMYGHSRHTYPKPHTTVTLDRLQAELIASLLQSCRQHLPSPKAVDAAVELLMGGGQ